MQSKTLLWNRFATENLDLPTLGMSLDLSRVDFPSRFASSHAQRMERAFQDMAKLEAGCIANPDENRKVGHYWLRNSVLCPDPELREAIEQTLQRIESFVAGVHSGRIQGAGGTFQNVLVIGIGGSALGPQFVAHALGHPRTDRLRPWFLDNTDPDGIDRVLSQLEGSLGRTLCVVISKSGGTPETRNGMLEAAAAWKRAGLEFHRHAVAITSTGSALDTRAAADGWLDRFPMWDWVGGRTSVTSAVGLLPAALQGIDIRGLLAGARAADEATRIPDAGRNPAMQLALAWLYLGDGRGSKDMVVLPYKDRLELFSRYLQQLVMESLGKERDLDGRIVHQGLAVYGNKGSTDQHAYVQQLRDGVPNFFAVFIEVLTERDGCGIEVEPGVTSGDYLHGFLLGTREALYDNGRPSITLTLNDVSAFSVGVLIALFERAVGLYASLIHVNAYHQPGVEAGKKAAAAILKLQQEAVALLRSNPGTARTAQEIAATLGKPDATESIYQVLRRLAANGRAVRKDGGAGVASRFAALT